MPAPRSVELWRNRFIMNIVVVKRVHLYCTLISHIPSFLRGTNRSLSSRTFPLAGITARKTEIAKGTEIWHYKIRLAHEMTVRRATR